MNKTGDRERLKHMMDAIDDIMAFIKDVEFEAFNRNKMMKLAIIKSIETIGEASASVSNELKTEYNAVEWQVLKGIRNIVVHEYFGINYFLIWNTIQKDIPLLKSQLLNILDDKNWSR